jgi:phage terminase small subunit
MSKKRKSPVVVKRRATLTPKQEAFALAYCRLSNASDAYREVYAVKKASAKTINEAGCRLLSDSKVAARITEVIGKAVKKAGIDVERTLLEVARISYFDPRKLFRRDGSIIPMHNLDDDTAAAIAGVEVFEKVNEHGKRIGITKKVKFWDKNSALEKAMKYLGMYLRDNEQARPEIKVIIISAKRPREIDSLSRPRESQSTQTTTH